MCIENSSFFCSWSGGKDSCLSLYHAIQKGGKPKYLFTMMIENGDISRSHGIPLNIIQKQAEALDIKFSTCKSSWDTYECLFKEKMKEYKIEGIEYGVFGDIDLDEHKDWEDKVCSCAGIKSYLPLWKRDRVQIVKEFINLGFKAMIICVDGRVLDKKFIGRILDHELINEMQSMGIDPCGEGGEFHTIVIDGPIFKNAVEININGYIEHEGYWFADMV